MTKMIDNGVLVLTADVGKVLCEGEIYGTTVRLAPGDDVSRWVEIAEEDVPKPDESDLEYAENPKLYIDQRIAAIAAAVVGQ